MTATTPTRPAAPSKDASTAHGSGNPVLDWARKNWSFLLLLAAALLAGSAFNYWLPRARLNSQLDSWQLFRTITMDPGAFSAERLAESLNRAREDDRIYPWVVERAVQEALRRGDRDALARLQPEVDALAAENALEGIMVVHGGGSLALVAHLQERVRSELGTGDLVPEFANPEPQGRRARITIKDSQEQTYDIVVGLYEDAAPATTAHFLELLAAERVVGMKAQASGVQTLRFAAELAEGEESATLPLERRWGLFNRPGALTTTPKFGAEPGQQDGAQVVLVVEAQPYQDGSTTVFAQLVEGQDLLATLAQLAPRGEPGSSASLEIVAAELVPAEPRD